MTSGGPVAERRGRPHVVAHVAVSLDGATTGFEPDVGLFYGLARTWHEDVTLAGADTILAQEPALREAPRPGPAAAGPLLAVVDGRGRVREWRALRECGFWSTVLALHCAATPRRVHPGDVEEIVRGTDRVDLAAALDALAQHPAVATVRVDSGGGLVGALLERGLVDEVSLLVHPVLVGDPSARRWYGAARHAWVDAEPVGVETHGALVWLRYGLAGRGTAGAVTAR